MVLMVAALADMVAALAHMVAVWAHVVAPWSQCGRTESGAAAEVVS